MITTRVLRIAGAACFLVLPTGLLRRIDLGDTVAAGAAWAILAGATTAAFAARGRRDEPDDSSHVRAALCFWVVALALLALVPVGPIVGGFAVGAVLVGIASKPRWSGGARRPVAWSHVLVALGVAVGVVAALPDVTVDGDGPAHVGGIRDALDAGRWIPMQASPSGDPIPDPRFGALHGLYAALAHWSGSDPVAVFRTATAILVPLGLLGHAAWMRSWGAPHALSIALALVFTLVGAGGRGFGLWRANFPGDAAIGIAAFAMAGIFTWMRSSPRQGLPWTAIVLLGASPALHPFAWWSATVVLAGGALLALLVPRHRHQGPALLGVAFLVGVLGVATLVPALARRAGGSSGLHEVPTDVVFLAPGSGWLMVDPLVLAHWTGWTALAVAPLLLLTGRSWWKPVWSTTAAFVALAPWLLALNPLVATPVWDVVSYLLIRIGRWILTPWWWWSLGRHALEQAGRRGTAPRVRGAILLLAVGLLVFLDLGVGWRVIRQGPPRQDPVVASRLQAMAEALLRVEADRVIADPRTSYALRARLGGDWPIVPVAHSNPLDAGLPDRLAHLRELHASAIDSASWHRSLARLGGGWILVNEEPRRFATFDEFGWIPSADAARRLSTRLARIAGEPFVRGEGWSLWSPVHDRWAADADTVAPTLTRPETGAVALASGSRFAVVDARVLADSVRAGGTVTAEIVLRAIGGPDRTVHPEWETIYVRWAGEDGPVPAVFGAVDKLYRKLVVERSARSEARFGSAHVPFAGTWAPGTWPADRLVVERIDLRVPPHARPGPYELELTVQEATWRPRRDLRDLLRDEDRYSGPVIGTVRVLPR